MKLQKIASLVLALVMIFSLGITAFADDSTVLGSVTVNGVNEGNIYEIYRLLDLESYDHSSGAYSYKVNTAWTDFFATADALKYVAIDDAGYVTWIAAEDDDTVATFAKIALDYAKANGIAPVKSSKNDGEFVITTNPETNTVSGKFSDLVLGYYLVDSNVGALCGLTTTNPDAAVNAKNGMPTVEKLVMEDSTNLYGNHNTADIGQVVYFHTNIYVQAGAQNYVLHDDLDKYFRDPALIKVELYVSGSTTPVEIPATETVGEGEDQKTVVNYIFNSISAAPDTTDKSSFTVTFGKEFCDRLEANDKVVVYYSALLTRNATIAGENSNPNKTWLTFGEPKADGTYNKSNESVTYTYTYAIDVVKTDSQNKLIDGAEFKIYDAEKDGNEVGVVLMNDGTYRRAREDEMAAGNNVSIIVKDGKVRVIGLDNGIYYLEETVAPAGYNKLTARQKFTIANGNLDAQFTGDIFSTGSGVHVVNKTGSMLPETGGMGTTIFYVAGGLLVGGAVVALVSKKRMSNK